MEQLSSMATAWPCSSTIAAIPIAKPAKRTAASGSGPARTLRPAQNWSTTIAFTTAVMIPPSATAAQKTAAAPCTLPKRCASEKLRPGVQQTIQNRAASHTPATIFKKGDGDDPRIGTAVPDQASDRGAAALCPV